MAKPNSRKMGRSQLKKRAAGPPPDPVLIPISQEFIGNDGPWSTFSLRLGTPPQFLKVLVSTSSPETLVVDGQGCTTTDPKECTTDRGQTFDSMTSTTWTDWRNGTDYPLDTDRGLPVEGRARYGLDVFSLNGKHNEPGMMVPNHVIAQISTKDYFLGMIGVSPRQLAPEKRREGHETSNIVDMKNRGAIPSLSYGYTAGARYRRLGPSSKMAHASLILGGYDKAASVPNNVDFKMGDVETGRDLAVSVRSISVGLNGTTTTTTTTPVLATPFTAVIDSSQSHYWLPREVCDTLARTLNLKYNTTLGLYLMNDTVHEALVAQDPIVSFTLADNTNPSGEVTIALPYASFELRLTNEYPHNHRWGRYFPIRPATNPMQFTLGRAFLQEAYLTANYESKNFSIAQRTFTSDRIAVTPIRDPSRPVGDEAKSAATYGLIAGGCALAGLLILFLTYRCARKRSKDMEAQGSAYGKAELDSTTNRTIFELGRGPEILEMDGKPSRVEAVNPDIKCAYDTIEELKAANGPFELPANEPTNHSSSTTSAGPSSSPSSPATDHNDDILISPVEGTVSSYGNFSSSTWDHTVSPITPSESSLLPMSRKPSEPSLPTIPEKAKHPQWKKEKT